MQRYGAFLYVDIEDSVSLSRAMKFAEYEDMLLEYSRIAKGIPKLLKTTYPEFTFLVKSNANVKMIGPKPHGDEVFYAIHLDYDIDNEDHYQPFLNCAVYLLLAAAIEFKNKWYESNVNDILTNDCRPRIELACGLHCGRISDNASTMEDALGGYHLGLGKRSETISRLGKYCHIVVSSEAYDALMGHQQPAYSLKQKLFFESLPQTDNLIKGISSSNIFRELKFYTRLWLEEVIEVEEQARKPIAIKDKRLKVRPFREKFWEYNLLSENLLREYHDFKKQGHRQGQYITARKGLAIAEDELRRSPVKEKVYCDMAFWYLRLGWYEMSIECGVMALKYNSEFDIAYQIIVPAIKRLKASKKEEMTHQDYAEIIELTKRAVCISPDSASNHYQLAVAYELMGSIVTDDNLKGYYQGQIVNHLRCTRDLDPEYDKRGGVDERYKRYWIKLPTQVKQDNIIREE